MAAAILSTPNLTTPTTTTTIATTTNDVHHDVTPRFDWPTMATGWYNDTTDWSNETTSNTSQTDDYPFVWTYIAPVVLFFGVVGNILTFAVMRRPRMKGTSTSVYLRHLAVYDTIALTTRIGPEFFKAIGMFVFSDLSRWTCKLEKFLFYTSSDIAIWILVLFTIDRLVAVCFPLGRRAFSVPKRALQLCLLVMAISVVKNVHVFWTRDIEYFPDGRVKVICGRPHPYYNFEEFVRPWIAFVTISVLPFCILIVSNCVIIRTLVRAHYRRRIIGNNVVGGGGGPQQRKVGVSSPTVSTPRVSLTVPITLTQTTLMCLSASLAFLVCVTPSIVLTIGRVHWHEEPHRQTYYLARAITHQLACLNHAINFFLYCLSGERFRRELLIMLGMRERTVGRSRIYSNDTTSSSARRTTRTTSLLAMRTIAIALAQRDRDFDSEQGDGETSCLADDSVDDCFKEDPL